MLEIQRSGETLVHSAGKANRVSNGLEVGAREGGMKGD